MTNKPSWKELQGVDINKDDFDEKDYIHALILKKDWKALLGFSNSNEKLFLKVLHISPVRKNIFSDLTKEQFIQLLDKSNDPIRTQIYQIMMEICDSHQEAVTSAAVELFTNSGQHPYTLPDSAQLMALLPIDILKKVLLGKYKTNSIFDAVQETLKGTPQTGQIRLNLDFLSLRDFKKRKSIMLMMIKIYEEIMKAEKIDKTEAGRFMAFIQQTKSVWKPIPVLQQEMKRVAKDIFKATKDANICFWLLCNKLPKGVFDFEFFYKCHFFNLRDFKNKALEILSYEAEKEDISETNLHLFMTKAKLPNNFAKIKSVSIKQPDSIERKIVARYEKEYQHVALDQLIRFGLTNMISYIIEPLTGASGVPFFSADRTLSIIKWIIEQVISMKATLAKDIPENYTRVLALLYPVVQPICYFIDKDFMDNFYLELFRHPTIPNQVNADFAAKPLDGLSCLLSMNSLKLIASAIGTNSRYKDQIDEYGFVSNRSVTFPPLSSSVTKKAEKHECKKIHVFELVIISTRLLSSQESNVSSAALLLYNRFLNKVLLQAFHNPDLCSRASEMHFRFCRFCMRDAPDLVSTNLITPYSLHAAAQCNSESIAELISMMPPACAHSSLVNLMYSLLQGFPDINKGASKYVESLVSRSMESVSYNFSQKAASFETPALVYEKVKESVDKGLKETDDMIEYYSGIDKSETAYKLCLNPSVVYEALSVIYKICQTFTPRESRDTDVPEKFFCCQEIYNFIKKNIFKLTINMDDDYIPKDDEFKIPLILSEATAPLFTVLLNPSPLAALFAKEDLFVMADFFTNFDPRRTKDDKVHDQKFSILSFIRFNKCDKVEVATKLLNELLTIDAEKLVSALVKEHESFTSVCCLFSFLAQKAEWCTQSPKMLTSLLAFVIKDLSVTAKEDDGEDNGRCSRNTARPVLRSKRVARPTRRGRQVCPTDSRFAPHIALIAVLSTSLRSEVFKGKVDLSEVSERIIEFAGLNPDVIISRVGKSNNTELHFSSQLAQLFIENIDFGSDMKTIEWIKVMPRQIYAFARLLSIPAFLYPCITAFTERVEKAVNKAPILSALQAITEYSMVDEKFSIGLAARNAVISLSLSPALLGIPLPQYCIAYIERISQCDLLTIDVVRTIATCVVAYFQAQESLSCGPFHFEELYKALMNMNQPKYSLLQMHMCTLIDESATKMSELKALVDTNDTNCPAYKPLVKPVLMPSTGAWVELQDRICSGFVVQGLLAKNLNVITITMKILTALLGRESISTIVAPKVKELLAEYKAETGITAALEFALTFCFQKKNEKHESTSTLIDFIRRFVGELTETSKRQAIELWVGSMNRTVFDKYNVVLTTINSCLTRLFLHGTLEQVLYMSELCRKIVDVLPPPDQFPVYLMSYAELYYLMKAFTYERLGDFYTSDKPETLFDFLRFATKIDAPNSVTSNTYFSVVFWLFTNSWTVDTLVETEKLEDDVVDHSPILFIATKNLFRRMEEEKQDILPYIKYSTRFTKHSSASLSECNITNCESGSILDKYKKAKELPKEKEETNRNTSKQSNKMYSAPDLRDSNATAYSSLQSKLMNVFTFF